MPTPAAPTPPPDPHRRVILFVDDEPDVLHSVAELLESALPGVQVLKARSGQQGLDLLGSRQVDAIIADFKMSGMDGIEFLYVAHRRQPNVPGMMLTAFANDALMRRDAAKLDLHAIVSKAMGPGRFIEQVAGLLQVPPARGPATAGKP